MTPELTDAELEAAINAAGWTLRGPLAVREFRLLAREVEKAVRHKVRASQEIWRTTDSR